MFVCKWCVLQKAFPLLPGGSFTQLFVKGILSLKMHQINKKKRLKSNFTTAKVHKEKKKYNRFPPSPKHLSLSMGSLRSCSHENYYTTATTNNALPGAFHLACMWMPVRGISPCSHIHLHATVCFVRSSSAHLCKGLSVCIAFCLGCIIRLFGTCSNRQLTLVSGWIDILIDFCIICII